MKTQVATLDYVSATTRSIVFGAADSTSMRSERRLQWVQTARQYLTLSRPDDTGVAVSSSPKVIWREPTEPGEMTREDIQEQIAVYEQMFGMSSEELLQSVHDGTVPDTFEINVWMALLEYR